MISPWIKHLKIMAIVEREAEIGGDIVDVTKPLPHKAGDLTEMMVAAGLDGYAKAHGGDGRRNWRRYGLFIFLIIGLGLTLTSFAAWFQMLNVQGGLHFETTDLSSHELAATNSDIGRKSTIWFFASIASSAFGMVFLGVALVFMLASQK